jgi:hypothetical protein
VLSFGAVNTVSAAVLQLALTVTTSYEAAAVDTAANEVVSNTLGTTLRQALVVTSRTYTRGVRVDLDTNVRTLTHQVQQVVINNPTASARQCSATVSVVDRKNVVAQQFTVDFLVAGQATFSSKYFFGDLGVSSRNRFGANSSSNVDDALADVFVNSINVDGANFSGSSDLLVGCTVNSCFKKRKK